jgi:hypothetical protein
MNIKTPPLSIKTVNVFPALFRAQFPDTLNAIRMAIPDWVAVHVISEGPAGKRGATPAEMRDELLAQLKPVATLYDPIHSLTTPEIPPNTIATFVPDQVKPSFAPAYEGWKFVFQKEARARLKDLFDRALGGIPEGNQGVADALAKGKIRGQAVLEGFSGSVSVPGYKRTMEAMVDPQSRVMFWDGSFGFHASGEAFLRMGDFIMGMFGAKDDRLYFDAAEFSWFVVFGLDGQMRVGMLG